MSGEVTGQVQLHSSVDNATDIAILCAIADTAHHDGVSYIPQGPREDPESIAFRSRCSQRTVERRIPALEWALEIEIRKAQKRRARINVYRILAGSILQREPKYDRLPFELDRPFSSLEEIERLRTDRHGVGQSFGELPVSTSVSQNDDQPTLTPGLSASCGGSGPVLEPTEEANASPVPADPAGERAQTRLAIELALSAELGVKAAKLTRSERGAWERAVMDLVDVDASAADVAARAIAYRELWPNMAMTPPALVRHWSMLGARVEIAAGGVSLERWLTVTMPQLEPEHARDIVDNWPGLTDKARVAAVEAIDAQHRRAA